MGETDDETGAQQPDDHGRSVARAHLVEAHGCFIEATERDPDFAEAWTERSRAALRLGDLSEGLMAAQMATSLDASSPEAWVALAEAQFADKRPQDAEAGVARALALEPGQARALGLKARILTHLGRELEASETLSAAVHAASQQLLYGLGDDWEGRFEEALEEVEADLSASPGDSELLVLRGRVLMAFAGRLEHLAEALQSTGEPDADAGAWEELASALYNLGRYEESAEAARRCCDLDPGYDLGYAALGVALSLLDRNEEALAAYERARDLDPEYSGYWHYCAELLEELGREQEAQAAYERAMELAASEDPAPGPEQAGADSS